MKRIVPFVAFGLLANTLAVCRAQTGEELILRRYSTALALPDDVARNDPASIRSHFARHGVRWPAGSSVELVEDAQFLAVRNTSQNQDLLDRVIFKEARLICPQIEIELQYKVAST